MLNLDPIFPLAAVLLIMSDGSTFQIMEAIADFSL